MTKSYHAWLKKYTIHVSGDVSLSLSKSLLTQNYPQHTWNLDSKQQYKQIKIVKSRSIAILTSMAGRSVKIYSLTQLKRDGQSRVKRMTKPIFTKHFNHQVIEVEIDPYDKYAFFSLTDFGKENLKDEIYCMDIRKYKKIFRFKTKGEWSKFIFYHPDKLLLISNWHSNNLSVIDIKNIRKPKLIQLLSCSISPRGIDFTPDGKTGLVAGYYSRNITFLNYNHERRLFNITKISKPFDYPNYSGNMRHVVVDKSGKYAYVSNMGRNLIHKVDINKMCILESFPVGTHPNTISLSGNDKYLAVSCRESDIACILEVESGRIQSIIDTGPMPTGLDFKHYKSNIYKLYSTSFEDDTVMCRTLSLP